MITAHTDVVGSLLRPPALLQAQRDLAAGEISAAEFKAVEDRAVDQAVALQERVGLDVVTDGEMRRLSFQSQMTAAVEGFAEHGLEAFLWGDWQSAELGEWNVERPALGVLTKLKRRRHLAAEEFVYLRARTSKVPKVTLPSPSLFVNFWTPEQAPAPYPTLDAFLEDVVSILRDEVAELVRLGATYVQLDAPHYTALLDPRTRKFYETQGFRLEDWLQRGIELENAVMEGLPPHVTWAFHL